MTDKPDEELPADSKETGPEVEAGKDIPTPEPSEASAVVEAIEASSASTSASSPPTRPTSVFPPPVHVDARKVVRVVWIPWVTRMAAAACLLVVGGVWISRVWEGGADVTTLPDGGPGFAPAMKLVEDAWTDYRQGRYAECVKKLDDAKKLYPDVDHNQDVQRLRTDATAALASQSAH